MDSTAQTHDFEQSEQSVQRMPSVDGDALAAVLKSLEWRSIGPYRGGRVVAVTGTTSHSQVFYFGSTGGGVWKTTSGGTYWENISDGFFKRASVGAIAVAPSDPNVIFVGMGETTIRGNVSHGDGVYKSTDGGKTWTHMGLEDTRNIGKIRIHPQNPDLVYVAALGHAHGPNKERGIYRSRDGGKTWEHVLFLNEDVGSHDLAMDPNNPRILYAALWRARRLPHTLQSGGEGCGIFKSSDGGDTWTDITRAKGLPTGMLGKIGVAVSGAKADRVWAIIEAEDGAVFRSDDGGTTWQRLSEDRDLRTRPWYYLHIYADPQNADTVWVLNEGCFKSVDGGSTFSRVATPHGDHHDLWIDPRDSQRIILGCDGGACVTYDGGDIWSSIYNQPTAEFYHVITDNQEPYRVYGAQQDNSTISVPSRSRLAAITINDYYEVGGGESGYIAIRPDNPNIVFSGSYLGYLTRYDHASGEIRDISVWPEDFLGWPAKEAKYRFQWTFPILLSPHDPNVLYATGNLVFRSTDEGNSWEAISPDLTRNDTSRMESSGGPLTKDNVGTEYYGTIFAFAESPLERGLFWAGSDDGLVHISRDGGESWQNVTPPELPAWSLISIIEPSPHDAATAYVAANRYKLDDFQPYLYKTNDYGETWTRITHGLPDNVFTRAIREDPARRGLLYAGTETGVVVSFDDGANWHSLQANLPAVPIHDLVVKDNDIVLATHGRSFWILDDITPLRELSSEMLSSAAHLFPPRSYVRYVSGGGWGHAATKGTNYRYSSAFVLPFKQEEKPNGEKVDKYLDAGQNPPKGVIVYYYLKEKPEGTITLTFLDEQGKEIKAFTSEEKKPEPSGDEETAESADSAKKKVEEEKEKKEPHPSKEIGLNRFIWNTRYPDAVKITGDEEDTLEGPFAPPGTYYVQLKIGDETSNVPFTIAADPHIHASQEDLQERFTLLMAIRDKVSEAYTAINMLRAIRQQSEEWERRTKGQDIAEQVATAAKQLRKKLAAIEGELFQVKAKKQLDVMDYPIRLVGKLAFLFEVVGSADAAPPSQARQTFEDLSSRVDTQLQQLREVIDTDVAAFNKVISEASVPAIVPTVQA